MRAKQGNPAFNFICNMRNYLNCFAQVVASAFLIDHRLVDPAGGYIICLGGLAVQETFIMAQVQIGFSTIIGHITFTMFIGIQGAWIHIDIWIQFLNGYPVVPWPEADVQVKLK